MACASRTLASASLPFLVLISSIAAWMGLPTSGRTVCAAPAPGSCARARAANKAMQQKRTKQRRTRMSRSAHKLLVADQADFFQPQALRRSHHHRHALVLDQLVGAQMHLGLNRRLGGRAQALLELLAIRNDAPVPDQGAV